MESWPIGSGPTKLPLNGKEKSKKKIFLLSILNKKNSSFKEFDIPQ